LPGARRTAARPFLGVPSRCRSRRTDALFSTLSRPDEHLAPQRWLGSLGRPTPRPVKHSHLKKHTAVARATAGKVWPAGALPVRPPETEHPPRAILAAHEVKHLDHLVSRSSYRVKYASRSSSPAAQEGTSPVVLDRVGLEQRVDSQRRQGTQGVHGDGGAEACSSTPHAAGISTLVALQPPLGV
jgi:hypothetical protein